MRCELKKQPITKADKLRRASKITWSISTLMTGIFIYNVLRVQFDNVFYVYGITILVSLGVQWIMTQVESALFSGDLTPIWQLDWKQNNGSLPWLYAGAILCLILDVLFNLGGVSLFLSKLGESDIGQTTLGMSTGFVRVLETVMIIAFSILFAVGSELLDEFASYVETGQGRSKSPHQQVQNNIKSVQMESISKPKNKFTDSYKMQVSEDELQIKRLLDQQERN